MSSRRAGLTRPGRLAVRVALGAGLAAFAAATQAAPRHLPPAPGRWVTDEASVLSAGVASAVDSKLEAFEKRQGSQVLVAIYPALPQDEVLEEYTAAVAEAWKVGRAKQDDGVVLFAFVADRALRLEVGYGLEGALTDLESKHILQDTLIPFLRQGDWDGGVAAAAEAILQSIEGEYSPDPGGGGSRPSAIGGDFVFLLILFVLLILVIAARRQRHGRWKSWSGGGPGGGVGGGWGGGSWGGGGGFGGGGGGFSGGGGSFGGGGASGRW